MPINKKYHPDYRKLYPGVKLSAEALSVLNKSDRKMEYIEHDLKHSRVRKNKAGEVVSVTPPLEYPLEVMQKDGQFVGSASSAEDDFFKAEKLRELCRCLDLLKPEERALIEAIYFDGLTEREYAKKTRHTHQSINEMKQRILGKLLKFMEN